MVANIYLNKYSIKVRFSITWFNKESHCSLRPQDSVHTNGRQNFRLMISKQEILKVDLIFYLSAEYLGISEFLRVEYRERSLLPIPLATAYITFA